MSWLDRAAQIVANVPCHEVQKLKEASGQPETPLYSVLSVTPPALSDDAQDCEAWSIPDEHGETFRLSPETPTAAQDGPAGALVPPQALQDALSDPGASARANQLRPIPLEVTNAQSAPACSGCARLNMDLLPDYANQNGGRRFFHWTCTAGHSILRLGYKAESVLVAGVDCTSYDPTRPTGPGCFH